MKTDPREAERIGEGSGTEEVGIRAAGGMKVQKKRKFGIIDAGLVLILLIGIGVLVYPKLSDYINRRHQSRAIEEYTDAVSDIDPEEIARMWTEAAAYNERLVDNPKRYVLSAEDEAEYSSILAVTATGIMSYVEIPKIGATLPVYHGLDEAILQIAIGHLPGSSVPVGGPSTHTVIAGHRGLPSAELFSDIDQLEVGDRFYIQTLGFTLTYEVDQIKTVLPAEVNEIQIEEDKDYVTLVTCTPYGVNSHRLLVRGTRIRQEHEVLPGEEGYTL